MGIKIIKDFIRRNIFSRPGVPMNEIKGLVVHWVAGPGATAKGVRNYFDSLADQDPNDDVDDRFAATQLNIGIDGEVVQCMPLTEMAYHVGARKYTRRALAELGAYPNNCTIGVEWCHPEWDGVFTKETYNTGVVLYAWLCKKYNLNPIDDIYMHYDVTGKECPRDWVRNPEKFEQFKKDVNAKLQAVNRKEERELRSANAKKGIVDWQFLREYDSNQPPKEETTLDVEQV